MRPTPAPLRLGQRHSRSARARGAFTLTEVLVVVLVILILIAIALPVGTAVVSAGRTQSTQSLIQALDNLVVEYTATLSRPIPSAYTDLQGNEFPIVDARADEPSLSPADRNLAPAEPSLALFLAQVRATDPALLRTLTNIAGSSVTRATIEPAPTLPLDDRTNERTATGFSIGPVSDDPNRPNGTPDVLVAPVVLDGWNRPIRFVHPAFDGGYGPFFRFNPRTTGAAATPSAVTRQARDLRVLGRADTQGVQPLRATALFSRAAWPFSPIDANRQAGWIGDSDEGITINRRPYFYSVGADGNPGTREDNVYTTTPTFPAESTPPAIE